MIRLTTNELITKLQEIVTKRPGAGEKEVIVEFWPVDEDEDIRQAPVTWANYIRDLPWWLSEADFFVQLEATEPETTA